MKHEFFVHVYRYTHLELDNTYTKQEDDKLIKVRKKYYSIKQNIEFLINRAVNSIFPHTKVGIKIKKFSNSDYEVGVEPFVYDLNTGKTTEEEFYNGEKEPKHKFDVRVSRYTHVDLENKYSKNEEDKLIEERKRYSGFGQSIESQIYRAINQTFPDKKIGVEIRDLDDGNYEVDVQENVSDLNKGETK